MPRHPKPKSETFPPLLGESEEGQLTVDVYERPSEFVVQSAVAGVEPEDLDINITDDMVTIRGKREKSREISDGEALYQECFWGSFSRSVILPGKVDPDASTAAIAKGVLTIRLPKVPQK